ncbi:MAG: hypothetical protein CMJ74_06525 [Planctomycetaceae bacterium]|nr:hypothetical protein [Planctomycetaceae bacterium]
MAASNIAGSPPLRIGAVNYLNTKPLIRGLNELAPHADLRMDLPSRLADTLAARRVDVALIPVVELLDRPDYRVVSDACIGCQGPVLSVKLFSRTPIQRIRSLALDDGSRTSVALVQILLAEQFGIRPLLETLPIGASIADTETDAVLLIGDRAIHSPPGKFCEVWDLGDRWVSWTKLPFVFAVWAAHQNTPLGDIGAALSESRDRGLAEISMIAHEESATHGLTQPQCLDYLSKNLNFMLGQREREGIELFQTLCRKWNLLAAPPENVAVENVS